MTAYAIAAALAVIVWAAGAMPVQSRQQNPPQFRVRTDLVQVAPVRADVSLKSLPAGSYRLRMIARSSAGEATREIGFAIKTQ